MPVRRYRVQVGADGARRLTVEVELDPAAGRARVVVWRELGFAERTPSREGAGTLSGSPELVEGRERSVELRAAPNGGVSWLDGTASVFARVEGAAPKLTVFTGGAELPVTVEDARAAALAEVAGKAGARASGPAAVRAPIPGRVVKLLVKAGDAVKAQQPVAVVEAMKMENELRAPRDGRVDVVRVSEGAAVESGQELLVVA